MSSLRVLAVVALAGLAGGCASTASTGAVPHPFPMPGAPTARVLPPAAETVSKPEVSALIDTALGLRGVPYRNGGTDPRGGFDCSGFTQYVFSRYGIALPRDVHSQFQEGKSVDRSKLVPGDLLFFATTERGPSHVGIVIGGDQFVHAPSTSGVVRIERFSSTYWSSRFLGARRLV